MDVEELTNLYSGTINKEESFAEGYKIFVCIRNTKMEAALSKRQGKNLSG
jgi:hypothetical protein